MYVCCMYVCMYMYMYMYIVMNSVAESIYFHTVDAEPYIGNFQWVNIFAVGR